MPGGIVYHCAECGRRLDIIDGYAICPRCHFDQTGDDPERAASERRAENATDGTEA